MTQTHQQHKPPLLNRRETYTAVTAAAYTAKAGDQVLGVNRAGIVTVTLPTAEVRPGRIYTVKDESGAAATNNITVATEGSETIDGSATNVLSTNYQAIQYYSDGSNWFVVPVLAAGGSSGGFTHESGNTTEATTTSTSAVDLMSVTGLTIPAVSPMEVSYVARKTSGAADNASCGLKLNATITAEAIAAALNRGASFTTGNQEEQGGAWLYIGPRLTNYETFGAGQSTRHVGSGPLISQGNLLDGLTQTTIFPVAEITSVIIRGITDDALNTLGVDEMHVYSKATS